MLHRDRLIYYSLKYQGDVRLIKKALYAQEEAYLVKCDVQTCVIGDDLYPEALTQLEDPPYVLYALGDLNLLKEDKISIIGSRLACSYALNMTQRLIAQLPMKKVIVSGLAKGIDAQAHLEALKKHKTIAILGCGIDIIYPLVNTKLYHQIKSSGLILSEYPPQTAIQKIQFIARNRIIAALGEELVVMQAALKSGTMSTVDRALNLGKDVYVLPYHADEKHGFGCNNLIQQGAMLLTSVTSLFKL